MSPGWFSSRAAAYWLIALVLFPFSAPMSVCDVADLVQMPPTATTAPLSNTTLRLSVVKNALAQPFPIRTGSVRVRRVAISDLGASARLASAQTNSSHLIPSRYLTSLSKPSTKAILRI